MAGRQRTTYNKLQRERARQEKQAAKRARRQGLNPDGTPLEEEERREPDPAWPAPPERIATDSD